jgi:2-polyprenyl-6-methoxyphenol hydroxylase-like FAD-dependent oxidoreductase
LGDAAATLHPLAGMGFNLVMGDLLLFEQSLKEIKQGHTIQSALNNYQSRMKAQRRPVQWMVDGMFALNRPNTPGHTMLSTAWSLAGALKTSPWLKNKFFESWIEPNLQRLLVHSFQKITQPFVLERLKNRD